MPAGVHDHHESLPGYDRGQVLHDGCAECERRATEPDHGLSHLDRGNFTRAWHRAAAWNVHGLGTMAAAEAPMFRMLWAVQLHLERVCGLPVGQLPPRWPT